ncbi:hypothetical protein PoB_006525300 [Plakobranchus ocellatus]|uniref:Uncharacterized protein n=1 Tax=Plakobranchus ocellatus TaxID=259542 RepID=A0AAV4D3Q6_9GAST|nr:hypothetical protein PoB_006525300 [Plakobranchus ocellatus]
MTSWTAPTTPPSPPCHLSIWIQDLLWGVILWATSRTTPATPASLLCLIFVFTPLVLTSWLCPSVFQGRRRGVYSDPVPFFGSSNRTDLTPRSGHWEIKWPLLPHP